MALVGPAAAGDAVYPHLEAVHDFLGALLLLLGADVNRHAPARHGREDVVCPVHNLGDDASNYHVLDAVEPERLHERLVVVEGSGDGRDVLAVLPGLLLCLGDGVELRSGAALAGREGVDGFRELPAAGRKGHQCAAARFCRYLAADGRCLDGGRRLFLLELLDVCLERGHLRTQGVRCGRCRPTLG